MSVTEFLRGGESLTPRRKKQREILMYLIFGGLTTLVNIIFYKLLQIAFDGMRLDASLFSYRVDLLIIIKVTVAWVAAVTFAFLTNRAWVFISKGPFFKEMVKFFSARIASLVLFETLLFYLMIFIFEKGTGIGKEILFIDLKVISFDWEFVIKLANSVLAVVPANYFFSKWFVFRKKPEGLEAEAINRILNEDKDGLDER